MSSTLFAIVHLALLVGIVVYAFIALFQGNTTRFTLLAACLIIYYFLVLHKAVKKEIERNRRK